MKYIRLFWLSILVVLLTGLELIFRGLEAVFQAVIGVITDLLTYFIFAIPLFLALILFYVMATEGFLNVLSVLLVLGVLLFLVFLVLGVLGAVFISAVGVVISACLKVIGIIVVLIEICSNKISEWNDAVLSRMLREAEYRI